MATKPQVRSSGRRSIKKIKSEPVTDFAQASLEPDILIPFSEPQPPVAIAAPARATRASSKRLRVAAISSLLLGGGIFGMYYAESLTTNAARSPVATAANQTAPAEAKPAVNNQMVALAVQPRPNVPVVKETPKAAPSAPPIEAAIVKPAKPAPAPAFVPHEVDASSAIAATVPPALLGQSKPANVPDATPPSEPKLMLAAAPPIATELTSKSDEVAVTPDGAKTPLPTLAERDASRVVIHYASAGARKRAETMRDELRDIGIQNVEVRKVRVSAKRDEIRYFKTRDRKTVTRLGSQDSPVAPARVRQMKGYTDPGFIEIWLGKRAAAKQTSSVRRNDARLASLDSAVEDKPVVKRMRKRSRNVVVPTESVRKPMANDIVSIRRLSDRKERVGRGYLGRPVGAAKVPSPREGWPTCDC